MYSKKFMRAYFEEFANDSHLSCCWQRYLMLVYINSRGNVTSCDLKRTRYKFEALRARPLFEKTLYKLAAATISYENPDSMQLYWDLLKHKERFLTKR